MILEASLPASQTQSTVASPTRARGRFSHPRLPGELRLRHQAREASSSSGWTEHTAPAARSRSHLFPAVLLPDSSAQLGPPLPPRPVLGARLQAGAPHTVSMPGSGPEAEMSPSASPSATGEAPGICSLPKPGPALNLVPDQGTAQLSSALQCSQTQTSPPFSSGGIQGPRALLRDLPQECSSPSCEALPTRLSDTHPPKTPPHFPAPSPSRTPPDAAASPGPQLCSCPSCPQQLMPLSSQRAL